MEEFKTLRDVPDYDGYYKISIDTKEGKCVSYYKKRWGKGEPHLLSNRETGGRINWCLCKNGKQTTHQAAVWIALTYPELVQGKYFEGAVIDHIDGDYRNNHPSNLKWCTQKENLENPTWNERQKSSHTGEKCYFFGQHHTEENKEKIRNGCLKFWRNAGKTVLQYTLNGEFVKDYDNAAEAQRQNPKFFKENIRACCRGVIHSYKGFKWKYKEQE